jgi:hypothetical protein
MKHHYNLRIVLTISAILCLPISLQARVVDIEVKKFNAFGKFKAGEFMRLEGELKGELDPTHTWLIQSNP